MRKNKNKYSKKAIAFMLALSMVIQPAAGAVLYPSVTAEAEEQVVSEVKYIDFNQIEQSDYIDAGTDANVIYDGTTATITATDWGNDWGADSKWQIQLKELVPVTANEKYDISFTITSEVARTVALKLGDLNADSTVFLEETIDLEAGTPYTYAGTTSEVSIEQMMVLFALGAESTDENTITISNFALKGETSGYVDTTPYINFNQIEQSDYIDAGTDANVIYDGTTVTITATDWGNDWGADSKWQIQLKELVPVTANEKYDISFTITSEVARTVALKLGDLNADGTVFLEDTVDLEAGTSYTYTGTTSEVSIEQLMILFALGAESTDENTITISNLSLKGETSGYVVTKPASDEKGTEYDFTADNSEFDYADPGTTKEGYDLIWADEFDGNYESENVDAETGLNLDNWAYQLGDGTTDCGNYGWGNQELQCYTGNKKNVAVNEDLNGDEQGDGLLRITASYEEDGYKYADETSKSYTSARLRTTTATDALFNTTYGYIESRMSLPGTKGAWPAFWMLPQSTAIYGGWPVSGEIDIMETVGAGQGGDAACGTLHWGAPAHVYKGSGYTKLDSNFSYFHTYAVDWEPGKMTWYYDGVAINTLTNWESAFSGASDSLSFDAPFDQPFYILLNLAVDSGQFGGNVNKAAFQDDINMYVDYVRVYQKTEGYEDSVIRTASGDIKDDWADYAGQNQIADITEENIVTDVADGNVNGVETSTEGADASKWYLAYQSDASDAAAEPYTDDAGKTWAKVSVNSKGSQDYSVQLIGHYNAKAGYLYQVSFDAYADGAMVGKTVNCDSKEWKGWSTYGIKSFELSDTATNYSYLVDQTEDFDDCRIEFNLGAQATGDVYIGNVKVEIVDPDLINREEARTALSDGNLIYNSTFDQGTYHLGYWSATEGTNLKVPRYTTEKLADGDVSVVDVASKTNYENIADGVKYYERRAQISAEEGVAPTIYQPDLVMIADSYKLSFDMYSVADTTVKASIYTVNEVDEVKTLGDELYSETISYKAANGVSNYKWAFDTEEDVENAALVLSFQEGDSVQIDNVKLIGASQGEKVDETPVTDETTWGADNGGGTALELTEDNGVYTISDVTSGNSWYAPQIVSGDFSLTNGQTYKLSMKYKMDGTSNNTFEYIVQENGGSWTVFVPVTKVTYDAEEADADGFCTYEATFTATTSLKGVHVVLGLGNSDATGDCSFSFKDVTMGLAYNISYELAGGINADANPTEYGRGQKNVTLAAPVKEGYDFLGWTVGKAGTDYIDTLPTTEGGDIVLYANWAVSKKDDGGTTPGGDTTTPGGSTTTPGGSTTTPGGSTTTPAQDVKAAKIAISGISKKIAAGKKVTLTAVVTPENTTNKAVTWTSSNIKYATVDAKGVVTTKSAGKNKTVTITATAADGSGVKATYKIKIMPTAVKKITLKASSTSVTAGKKVTIKATVSPSTSSKKMNKTLKWTSSNTKYATVNAKGVVTTKKAGKGKKVKITAKATDGSNKKKTITIKIK